MAHRCMDTHQITEGENGQLESLYEINTNISNVQKALGKMGTPIPESTIQTEYRGHHEPEHHGPELEKWLGKLGSSGPFFSYPGCAKQIAASLSIGKYCDEVNR